MQSLVLSSLSNETRLRILLCLSNGEKNVSQLIGNCGLSQSAVSQHLEKLRKSGLVTTKRQGKEIFYALTYPKTATISKQLLTFLEEIN